MAGFSVTRRWNGSAVVNLTAQELSDIAAARAAEADANLRARAKEYVDNHMESQSLIVRALALTVLDEINILRAEHSLTPRTTAQLKAAIEAKVDDNSADNMS